MFKEANRIQVKEDLSYHKGESQVGYPSQPIEKKKNLYVHFESSALEKNS